MSEYVVGDIVVFNNSDHEVYARHTYEDKTGKYVTYDLAPIERRGMISRAAKVGWECDQKIAKLRAFVKARADDIELVGKYSEGRELIKKEAQQLLKEIHDERSTRKRRARANR